MIKFVKGDMFLTECVAIGHGCNCEGYMGSGVAFTVKNKYPLAFNKYRAACRVGSFQPGSIQTVKCRTKIIVNMGTQAKIVRKDGSGGAKPEWIKKCLQLVENNYEKRGFDSIAFPIVGCSLGGLNWADIKPIFIEIFEKSNLKVVVYEEFLPDIKADETFKENSL